MNIYNSLVALFLDLEAVILTCSACLKKAGILSRSVACILVLEDFLMVTCSAVNFSCPATMRQLSFVFATV